MSRWMTSGGSVWWYTDFWSAGEASVDQAPPGRFNIDSIVAVTGQLTEDRLHQMLWVTQQQFVGMQVRCSTTPALRMLLEGLTAKGLATWRAVRDCQPPRLELLSIRPPPQKSDARRFG